MVGGKMGIDKKIFLGGLLFGLFCVSDAVANTLENITYSILSGGRVQIVMETTEPVQGATSFATDSPARIAVDLPNTKNGLKKRTRNIGSGSTRSVTAIEAGDKTRVVVNLASKQPYEILEQGNKILLMVNGSFVGSSVADASAGGGVAGSLDDSPPEITHVDFRRGGKGVARVEVTLSDPDVVVDMRREGTNIVLDFLGTEVDPEQARELDVTDFATVVQSIVTKPHRKNTRMIIGTKGEFEHLAYQADNLYTLEFREVSKEEKEQRKKKQLSYVGEKLSLNFQDIEVRSVLQLLADFTGLNMVVSDSVSGRITLRLKNVPWDQALDIILKTKGLSKRQNGNVILVAPTEEIAAREKLELESQKQVEELAPLHSELIQINYAKAETLADLLKSEENQLLSERGNVTIDERTNTLLVQDTATKLGEIRALIEKLDIPVRQVLVESRIVIANDDFARDIGVRFGFNRENSLGGNASILTAGGLPGHTEGTFGFAPGIENPGTKDGTGPEALMVNLPQQLAPGRGGAINFLVGKVGSYLLQLELTAMQQEGRGEIVSSPRVITSDQNKATIKQGVEIPYQKATSSGATAVAFKEAVLKLEVTPHITPDDRIIMDLLVSKDDADFTRAVLGVPPLNKREVETRVLVDNGETVVLGGVFEREKKKGEEKVPFFGDLPIVGHAFKQTLNEDRKKELLIFITPKIIKDSLTVR
ncbi:type IV pilus secretin PilQ [Thiolapillus sp.]